MESPITDTTMKNQVIIALDGRENEFEVEIIVEVIKNRYGLISIETVPDYDFWRIVKLNEKTYGERGLCPVCLTVNPLKSNSQGKLIFQKHGLCSGAGLHKETELPTELSAKQFPAIGDMK